MSAPIAANIIGPHNSFPFQGFAGAVPPHGPPTAHPEGILSMGRALFMVEYQVSIVQLLALPGTKLQLVASPAAPPKGFGSAFMLEPESAVFQYKFGTTAFTLGNADNKFQIEYTGQTTALIQAAAAGLVDQVASTVIRVGALAAGAIAQALVAGLGLELTLVGTAPALTLGDGILVVFLNYGVRDLQ